jgi:cyclopropane-fatty-acyl-phospholipid synthase
MIFTKATLTACERLSWPDPIVRAASRTLIGRTRRRLRRLSPSTEADFAAAMANLPIAAHTQAANDQHYGLPPEFFVPILGPQRKYSCCFYRGPDTMLAQAEEDALAKTATNAAIGDGQRILDLGCGWGALSLWMARRYHAARIVAVSNSYHQVSFIRRCAEREGLRNLTAEVADMNTFNSKERFDRIVSVEMFEHMSNWHELLRRMSRWTSPDGAILLHVFSHRRAPYRFDVANPGDWIAQHFFTGGIMPSAGLMRHFADVVEIEQEWRWDGKHYRRTAEDWLANYDRSAGEIASVLAKMYGSQARLWRRRWRLFFLATAELFGTNDGQEWGVSHYRLKPQRISY